MKLYKVEVMKFIVLIAAAFSLHALHSEASCSYPETKRIDHVDVLHGTTVEDPYRWLEGSAEDVKAWARVQNELAQSVVSDSKHLSWLKERYDALSRYDETTAPREVLIGKRCFFWAKTKDQDRRVLFTMKNREAESLKLIDPNDWDEDKSLEVMAPSRDGRYVAYGIAVGGDENPQIRILDVETGKTLPDTLLGWRQSSVNWHPNNVGFFYSTFPSKGKVPDGEEYYWHSVYYHKLGTSSTQDVKVFFSEDEKECFHGGHVTEDGKWEIFSRDKFSENEVFFRAQGSDGPLTPLATGFESGYGVDIYQEKIFILTDKNALLYQIFVTDVQRPERKHWKVLIPENPRSKIEWFRIIGSRLYVQRMVSAHSHIEIYDLDGTYLRDLSLPEIGSAFIDGYAAKPTVFLTFTSFFCPPERFEYDFDADTLTSIHRIPVNVDTSSFEVKQVWYPSKDGTSISMFVMNPKGIKLDGSHPTLLTGYGGFDISITPGFVRRFIPWLESGGVVAIPNLRGGGEYGQAWHKAGMKENKQNVFDDFIAAAEWLIDQNYTRPEKLAIRGGSNGGLLVGAAMTQRPELFRAVLCQVPLLDMIRFHKFGLANIWKEEYGSAEDPDQFSYLFKYSPYHNIKVGTKYPATLITGADNDARVDACHARKMVARLQHANASEHPIVLFSEQGAGHCGGTTLTQNIDEWARQMGFLMQQLDMPLPAY